MRVAINYATWKTPRVYARCMAFSIWHDLKFIARTPTISRKIRYKWYIVIESSVRSVSKDFHRKVSRVISRCLLPTTAVRFFFLFFFIRSERSDRGVASVSRHGYPSRKRRKPTTCSISFIYETRKKKKKKKNRRPFICTGRLSNSPSWHHRCESGWHDSTTFIAHLIFVIT